MSSFGPVPLKELWAMLAACADGHAVTPTTHHYRVDYNGKSYYRVPKGAHGARNPEIEAFHVRKVIRHLGIDPKCASKYVTVASEGSLDEDVAAAG